MHLSAFKGFVDLYFLAMGKDHLELAVSQAHPCTFFINLFIQNANIVQTESFAFHHHRQTMFKVS